MNEERLQEIEARDKARTQGKWQLCGDGKCECKQIWTDDYPIACVEKGRWGDRYAALRVVGEGLDKKVEAYMDQISYGDIPGEVADANAAFITACSEDIPALLAEVRRLQAEVEALKATSCANSAASHKILTAAQPRARMGHRKE